MKVNKERQGGEQVALTGQELEEINRLSRRELTQEEVYTFSVRLCDNEVDRDGERFPRKTLEQLAQLFVGKSGIFDHDWSARGQAARIYRTQLVEEPERVTKAGDPYCWLKGYAYMVRTQRCTDLIQEIEGGIKKEVSVGCAVERAVCSICGAERGADCGHRKGQYYDGRLCFDSLEEAKDAYEFSFVAVPAQPGAGVVKGGRREVDSLKALVRGHPCLEAELTGLEKEAGLGRHYLERLRQEVVRLGTLADQTMEGETLKQIARRLEEDELLALRRTFETRAEQNYPLKTQLRYGGQEEQDRAGDRAFLI